MLKQGRAEGVNGRRLEHPRQGSIQNVKLKKLHIIRML